MSRVDLAPVVATVLPVLAITAGLAWSSQRSLIAAPLPFSVPTSVCSGPARSQPSFRVEYQHSDQSLLAAGQGFRFQGVAWLGAQLCSPGTLRLSADGEVADGEAPRLIVTLDNQVVRSEPVGRLRTLRVRVPSAGHLRLAYLNDFYRADVRIADFQKFSLEGTTCPAPGVKVTAPGPGAVWNADTGLATLTWAGPLKLRPCGEGVLHLQLRGRSAHGTFPALRVEQAGRPEQALIATDGWSRVSLPVGAGEISIQMTNPLNQTLADRNLNLRSIEFVPDQR